MPKKRSDELDEQKQTGTEPGPAQDAQADPKPKAARIVKKTKARPAEEQPSSLVKVKVERRRVRSAHPGLLYYTWIFVYKNLYILGVTLLRRGLRVRRRLRLFVSLVKGTYFSLVHRLGLFAARLLRSVSYRIRFPFQRIRETYRQQLPAIRLERKTKRIPLVSFLPVLEVAGRLAWKILSTVFNYAAPVVAVIILATTVVNRLSTPIALRLEYDGEVIGYIQNESVFDEATQIVRERVISQQDGLVIGLPSFVIEEVETTHFLDKNDIADIIIWHSGEEIEMAYGLYVSNEFMGAVTDKDAILDELEAIMEENTTGRVQERVEFVKSISLREAVFPSSSVVDDQALIARLRGNETEQEIYIVQDGDTPTGIADKVGMRYADLRQFNPDIEEGIRAGDEILTAVARPFLSVKNTYVITEEQEIPYERIEVENSLYARGHEEITQEGQNGLRRVVVEETRINNLVTERVVLEDDPRGEILRHAIAERVIVGINDPSTSSPAQGGSGTAVETDRTPASGGVATSGFMWPTTSGRATTYAGHTNNGVDIAIGAGVPIYASRSGVVTKSASGYTGYGNHIIIDHGDGYTTLYAHNSANYVSVGEYVNQGDVIAAMGRTGWATGNHVHFEVRYNGRPLNPTQFIGYSR